MRIINGLLTPLEAAKRLGFRTKHPIYDAIKHGRKVGGQVIKLPTVKALADIRIHSADLATFIAKCNAAEGNTASPLVREAARAEFIGMTVEHEPAYPTSGRGKGRKGGGVGTEAFDGRRGRRE